MLNGGKTHARLGAVLAPASLIIWLAGGTFFHPKASDPGKSPKVLALRATHVAQTGDQPGQFIGFMLSFLALEWCHGGFLQPA